MCAAQLGAHRQDVYAAAERVIRRYRFALKLGGLRANLDGDTENAD
jgi:hypothetical protein